MAFLGDAAQAALLTVALCAVAGAFWREALDEYADVWRYWFG